MTQVSKKQLGKQLEKEIYDAFWTTLAKLTNKNEIELFLNEFFSRNEKINFVKRLSIAILLYKGYDWRSIRDLIKVSEGTIAKMSSKIATEGFKMFFSRLEKDERWRVFWHDLAKTYLSITHPEKFSRLDGEGIERIYLRRKKKILL